MISCATIISQSFLLLAACINMNQKGNAFGFSLRAISIKKEVICPMLTLSFPVIVERIAFAVGKVIVNSMSTVYGSWTVGALGISNNIGGITTNPQNGFQEGGSSIISNLIGVGLLLSVSYQNNLLEEQQTGYSRRRKKIILKKFINMKEKVGCTTSAIKKM